MIGVFLFNWSNSVAEHFLRFETASSLIFLPIRGSFNLQAHLTIRHSPHLYTPDFYSSMVATFGETSQRKV